MEFVGHLDAAAGTVTVAGNYAYVTDEEGGLRVVDVWDAANPTEVGSYETPWAALGVAAAEGYVYTANGYAFGLLILRYTGDEYWHNPLAASKRVDQSIASSGDRLTYQVTLSNSSILHDLPWMLLTDTIPNGTTYSMESLSASTGAWGYSDGVITWTGGVSAGKMATITYGAMISNQLSGPHVLVNQAVLDDQVGVTRTLQAATLVDPLRVYLMLVLRSIQ